MRKKLIKVTVSINAEVEIEVPMPINADEEEYLDDNPELIHEFVKEAVYNTLTEDETSIEEWEFDTLYQED